MSTIEVINASASIPLIAASRSLMGSVPIKVLISSMVCSAQTGSSIPQHSTIARIKSINSSTVISKLNLGSPTVPSIIESKRSLTLLTNLTVSPFSIALTTISVTQAITLSQRRLRVASPKFSKCS